jgi:two-component system sensor histidine kinase YesM
MKNILRGVYGRLRRLPLRARLFFFISVLLVFAVCFLSFRVMGLYQRDMVQSTGEQTLSSLRQTAQRINQKLATISDALDQITMDSDLTDFFIEKQTGKDLQLRDLYLNVKWLGNTIGRYLRQEGIDTYLFYTEPYLFGGLVSTQGPAVTPAAFEASRVYETAVQANYSTVWLPVYSLESAFDLPSFSNPDRLQGSQNIFSAVRQLNFMYYKNSILRMMPASAQRPILMVNFKEAILKDWIGDNIGYDRVRYRLLSSDRKAFYDSAPGTEEALPALYTDAQDGVAIYGEGAQSRMAFISPIPVASWYLACDIPLSDVVGNTTRNAFGLLLWWIALLLIVSLVLAYLVARGVTKPIGEMTRAVKKVAAGDFSVRMKVPQEKEFWELTTAFNQMGGEIDRLIYENYAIKLKETQSQLIALNLQLNPHFLYNTLNVMNLISLENGQRELSQMIGALSRMLQYALKQTDGLVSLSEELEWLKNYLTIMEGRFDGMFEVAYDVEEAAYSFQVPKLILQPIVENCFVHGHIGSQPGGRITLSVGLHGQELHLSVEDNGEGMDVTRVLQEMRQPAIDRHIGLSNAYQRMKLIYGKEADIHLSALPSGGSRVTLVIPQKALEEGR